MATENEDVNLPPYDDKYQVEKSKLGEFGWMQLPRLKLECRERQLRAALIKIGQFRDPE